MEKCFVAIGTMVIDVFHKKNDSINYASIGGCRFNVIANLAYRGNKTKILTLSNNEIAKKLKQVFLSLNTEIPNLNQTPNLVKINHLLYQDGKENSFSNICPICSSSNQFTNHFKLVGKEFINENDVILLDNLNEDIINTMLTLNNDFVLDMGHAIFIKNLTDDQLDALNKVMLSGKIKVLQMSKNTSLYFKQNPEVYNKIFKNKNIDLIVQTFGEQGAIFTTKGNTYHKPLELVNDNVADVTGLGDSFLSVIIEEYYKNNKLFKTNEEKFITLTNQKACQVSFEKSKHYGALGHLGIKPQYKIKDCFCELNK